MERKTLGKHDQIERRTSKDRLHCIASESPVTPVLTQGSTDLCQDIMRKLREEHGVFVSGVAYPVVPRGTVLIRLIPTAAHNDEHIEKTLEAFDSIKDFVFAAAAEIAS